MNPKNLKEEVEEIDRKVLAYCEGIEAALEPVVAIQPKERSLRADQSIYLPPDGMDLPRAVHRQVVRARNLAWAIQRLPYLDLSFMSTMKKVVFKADNRQRESRDVEVVMPAWVSATYPAWEGAMAWHDPKAKTHECVDALGLRIAIPDEVVTTNDAAVGSLYLQPKSSIPPVPGALRRKIDPFLSRFDQVAVIAEADWHAVPGADPLVVGVIYGGQNERHVFLLGEYDPTKLEKYIIAELAVKPKE
jgi:hypothetical protein